MREQRSHDAYAAELLALVTPNPSERLPVAEAAGRVLAADLTSAATIPGFDNSAMDGYAVRLADLASVPATLTVVGEVAAGSPVDPTAQPGECVRIMTGAALPSFADAVVPVEDTDGGTQTVEIRVAPERVGAHIRRAGEDISLGDPVASAGSPLTPALIGAIVAAGIDQVEVAVRPVVAVGVSGDELVRPPAPLQRGQLYESNSLVLGASLTRDGAELGPVASLPDDPARLTAWLDQVTAWPASLVVLTGGASVGAYDVVRDVLQEAGGTYRSVLIQPGKPQGWAVWNTVPVVSLPGNPTSAAISYEMFVRPMIDRFLGRAAPTWFPVFAAEQWRCPPGRAQVLPVRLDVDEQGRLQATPAHRRGSASHLVTSLAHANALVLVGEQVDAVSVGDRLVARWLEGGSSDE